MIFGRIERKLKGMVEEAVRRFFDDIKKSYAVDHVMMKALLMLNGDVSAVSESEATQLAADVREHWYNNLYCYGYVNDLWKSPAAQSVHDRLVEVAAAAHKRAVADEAKKLGICPAPRKRSRG